MDNDLKLLKKYLKNKNRVSHSISTAEYMRSFATFYSIDKNNAYFCGFYHDIGKELSGDEILSYVDTFMSRGIISIDYLDFKKKYPSLLHGVASAEILINEIGLSDNDIITAICSHTLGARGLSRLSKYTFMMDFCEPLRKHEDSVKVFKILTSEKNFDRAYLMTYHYQLKELLDNNKEICLETVEGYNEAKMIASP